MQLERVKSQFTNLGVNVAAITYDSSATNLKFVKQFDTGYPLLSDVGFVHANSFGVLNEAHEPGDYAYGVAHPGMMWISPEGLLRLKFAEPGFRKRPDFEAVIAAIKDQLAAHSD